MKRYILILVAGAVFCFTSCYCDKHIVGNINYGDELVHVKSVRNAHFFGLAVNKGPVENQIKDEKDYVLEVKRTFWDGVVTWATMGIYSPTTTKYYLKTTNPKAEVLKKKMGSKAYEGYMKK